MSFATQLCCLWAKNKSLSPPLNILGTSNTPENPQFQSSHSSDWLLFQSLWRIFRHSQCPRLQIQTPSVMIPKSLLVPCSRSKEVYNCHPILPNNYLDYIPPSPSLCQYPLSKFCSHHSGSRSCWMMRDTSMLSFQWILSHWLFSEINIRGSLVPWNLQSSIASILAIESRDTSMPSYQ